MSSRRTFPDFVGVSFGRLTVIALASGNSTRTARWTVRCNCGSEKELCHSSLTGGHSKSCGCLRREVSRERARVNHRKHGMTRSKEWTAWFNMKQRVLNPKDISYELYNKRGITIFPPWVDSFEAFFSEIGPAPSPKDGERYSVDRIDNDRGYEPGNVRWATYATQANNRSTNVFHDIGGRTLNVKQISEKYNIPLNRLNSRLHKGWPIDRAALTPRRGTQNAI